MREQVVAVHQHGRGTYGSPRVHAELRARGRKRVARLMSQQGLAARLWRISPPSGPAGLALPGRHPRPLLAPGGGLGDERAHRPAPGPQCTRHGAPGPAAAARTAAPLGPVQSVRQRGLPAAAGGPRHPVLHEPQGPLLGQRRGGALLHLFEPEAQARTRRADALRRRSQPLNALRRSPVPPPLLRPWCIFKSRETTKIRP